MPEPQREPWEKEILARHRWGQHGRERAEAERARLKTLRDPVGPIDATLEQLIAQIIGPEICNWRLEEMILSLCDAIGRKQPLPFGTGHAATITDERRARAWAYYLALRHWQHDAPHGGFRTLLAAADPDGEVERHVREMLGDKDGLKALYVERFCLCLEALLGERFPPDSPQAKAHAAAVAAVEEEIRQRDPEGKILDAIREYRQGDYLAYVGLEFCHHKIFRRIDVIISSIGAGSWRAAMPERGTDGFERADTVEKYLVPIEAWLQGSKPGDDLARDVAKRLGGPDPVKLFLASLMVSLLRSQALAARKRAERRAGCDA